MQPSDSVRIVVFRNSDGRFAVVAESDDPTLKLPGGKIEPGEAVLKAAQRELEEELALVDCELSMKADLLNNDGVSRRYIFTTTVNEADVQPTQEIAELHWLHKAEIPAGKNQQHMLAAVAACEEN